MKNIVTGVDIGGTHITVCLVDIITGRILEGSNVRMYVDTSLDKDAIIASWTGAIMEAHRKTRTGIQRIGIAMPGPFDYQKGISFIRGLHKYESLYNLNVKDLLADKLGIPSANIRFVNDASAYLLGEVRAGAGKGFENVVGITLGTGLGSAVLANGRLQDGDLYCTDFNDGKCEDFVSARWLIAEYEKLSGRRLDNVKQIADNCDKDHNAKQVFEHFGRNLYNVLRHRYLLQPPELVVIGGNIAKAWDQFIPFAMQEMVSTGFHFQFRKAELGEEAALTGAAFLWE